MPKWGTLAEFWMSEMIDMSFKFHILPIVNLLSDKVVLEEIKCDDYISNEYILAKTILKIIILERRRLSISMPWRILERKG